MSYKPLAVKYRPSKFSDLVGQESATKALSNAIAIGREPHAVIFSGVRGIGKTTTARLYAKALNCDNSTDSEPCGVCDSCLAIAGGFHEDVVEIDGASNNGVDEIRSLKESVQYAPQRSKFKVYIIDEVHMLSINAFNALLKTLEEPPAHVVFVMATTELHKLPQTVVGRCQTFYLKKLSQKTTGDRIQDILQQEKINFESDAVDAIAYQGKGSMRDALTFLDQVIAIGQGKVTLAAVNEIVPSLSIAPLIKLIKGVLEKDADASIDVVSELEATGMKMTELVEKLIETCRHAFIAKSLSTNHLSLRTINEEEKKQLVDLCEQVNPVVLNQVFRVFVELRKDLDGSLLDRFLLENVIIEWCVDPGFPVVEDFLNGSFQTSNATMAPPRKAAFAAPQASPTAALESGDGETNKPAVSKGFKAELDSLRKKKVISPEPLKKTIEPEPVAEIAAPTEVPVGVQHPFPESWSDLVMVWKQDNPLEGRKLEELKVSHFDQDKMVIWVDPTRGIASALLQPERQQGFQKVLKSKFGFNGHLDIRPLQENHQLPDSLLEKKEKQAITDQADLEQNLKTAPLTKALLQEFNGKISRIHVVY